MRKAVNDGPVSLKQCSVFSLKVCLCVCVFVCLCEHSDLLVPAPEECFYHHFIPQILTNPRADLANVE